MKICILIINDGRNDYLDQTLKSLKDKVVFPIDAEIYKVLYDDMPEGRDAYFLSRIELEYNIDKMILSDKRVGINQAVQNAWMHIPKCDYIWHQENDFTYNAQIDVSKMIAPLEMNRMIGQVALLRQPWYDDEVESDGMYKVGYRTYRQGNIAGIDLVFQDLFFTHNPCIYRYSSIEQIPNYSEIEFAAHLKKRGCRTFAYLGTLTDEPLCHHIGVVKK